MPMMLLMTAAMTTTADLRDADVFIVAPPEDVHALSVARCVEQHGARACILDTRKFPRHLLASGGFDIDGSRNFRLEALRAKNCESPQCNSPNRNPFSVWWRRPRGHSLVEQSAHPSVKEFSHNESRQMLLGTLLSTSCFFMNDPGSSRRAALKPYHLALASELGFLIPKTLMTNNVNDASRFIEEMGTCIYKTFTGVKFALYETRLLKTEDKKDLWRLNNCPIILQEHIDGDYDVRATVVGNRVFAARLLYKEGKHGVDSRVERVPVVIESLPQQIIDLLLKLKAKLGLSYMAADLRHVPDRGYVFFETNPEGQFLWIEIETGLPISNAIAEELLRFRRAA
jgi:glutathione synthase/RimK-type ligase-like ATP-grasp enzyme